MISASAISGWFGKAEEALRLRGPLASNPSARVLHSLLLWLAGWRIASFALILPFATKRLGVALLFSFILAIDLAGIRWLRRNSLAPAALTFLTAHWLAYTIVIALSSGIHSRGMVMYLVLPISAAWLMGTIPALLSAGICLASTALVAVLQNSGVKFPDYFETAGIVCWSETLVAAIIILVPVLRILQILQEALDKSRTAEQALEESRIGLEAMVQNRTAELEEARDQAQATSRAKTAFLATLSHQLRSPLNAILLLSEIASTDPHMSEEHCQDWRVIHRSGQHLLHLIDQVLDAARIEAGQVSLENVRFDLAALLQGVVDLMRVRAEQKNLLLRIERPGTAPQFVYGDQDKLRHVLINLIDNAIKYTEVGYVVLSQQSPVVEALSRVRLRFEIADTGIGIAHKDQERVFEPFMRVASAAEGVGLGLAITRQYVELMGGSIRVESVPGRGSRFFVEVPVGLADSDVPAEPESVRVPGLSAREPEYRVLIIENRLEDRVALMRTLERAGFLVRTAETGAAGIDLFETSMPHLVLMECSLPDIEGSAAACRIRTMNGGREIKIVGIGSSIFSAERELLLAAGFDDFVRSPIQPVDLLKCVTRQLNLRFVSEPAIVRSDIVGGAACA
jgi:signal transduction histidine kinase/ActR/RegA family two-component response regulator